MRPAVWVVLLAAVVLVSLIPNPAGAVPRPSESARSSAAPTSRSLGTMAARAAAPVAPLAPRSDSNWSAVEVVFAIETSPYDGAFDPTSRNDSGYDPCLANGSAHPCEESNSVPFFLANAGPIAEGIAAAHPGVNVSFAMVDYSGANGGTVCDPYDDCDSAVVHADVANFTAPTLFGNAVNATFGTTVVVNGSIPDTDLNDTLLHSSSITALYGTLAGGLVDWSSGAHHVVVQVGSTAPRDPHYPENYSVSASANASSSVDPIAPTCEASYPFPGGASPNCEGWIVAQDGNTSHSIAALASSGAGCAGSLGGNCTIDTIDLWTTSTDPASPGWPAQFASRGGGADGPVVVNDTDDILASACAIAQATGGTWDGPSFDSCGWQNGTLTFTGWNATFADSAELYQAYLDVGVGRALTPASYPVWFNETGLPAGTNWSVQLNGQTQYSSTSSLEYGEPNGSGYPFTVAPVPGFDPEPSSGTVDVSGGSVTEAITFSAVTSPNFPLWFNETGLASGTNWSVQVLGTGSFSGFQSNFSTGSSIEFEVVAGLTGEFLVTAPTAYLPVPKAGPVHTSGTGAPLTITVSFSTSPSITAFGGDPATVTLGEALTFSVTTTGGSAPLSYLYLGLPAGCPSENRSTLSCTPDATGTSTVTVRVTDPVGRWAEANATVTVRPVPNSGGGNTSTSPNGALFGGSTLELVSLVVGAVAVVAALVGAVLWRRRRGGPPGTDPPPDGA